MTAALITRLLSGGAVLEVSGHAQVCADWRAAVDEATSRGLSWSFVSCPALVAPGEPAVPPFGGFAAGSAPTGPAATNLPGHASARAGGAFTSG